MPGNDFGEKSLNLKMFSLTFGFKLVWVDYLDVAIFSLKSVFYCLKIGQYFIFYRNFVKHGIQGFFFMNVFKQCAVT